MKKDIDYEQLYYDAIFENKELKQQHEFAIKTLQEQHKAQLEGLKNTIVQMSVNVFSSQDSFMTVFKNIDKKLDLILGGK